MDAFPQQAFPLTIAIVSARILGPYQDFFASVEPCLTLRANPPSRSLIDTIQQRYLTDDQKRELFGRLARYLLQIPPALLCEELVRLERYANEWEMNVQIDPQSLIAMVITLAISATHRDIDARALIVLFQPFVQNHVDVDPILAPLLDMLRMPETPRNVRTVWLAQIEAAFRVLLQNMVARG